MKTDWWAKAPAVAMLALTSCGSSADTKQGDLGNGVFTYECVSTTDPACATNSESYFEINPDPKAAQTFPAAIASGSKFKLRYDATKSNAGNPSLRPVSPAILDFAPLNDGTFLALRPGIDAIVARSTADSLVYDYTYAHISPISEIDVIDKSGGQPPSTAKLSIGEEQTYVGVALDPFGDQLAGAIDYTWSVSDETVLELEDANPISRMDVKALAAGTATVTLSQGTFTKTVTVQVSP